MLCGVVLEGGIQNGQDNVAALGHEGDDVLIVPEEKRTLGHLEVRRVDAARDQSEQRLGHLGELSRLRQFKQLLQLVEEHNLLLAVCMRPILDQAFQDHVRKFGVLLQVLSDTVRKLLVVLLNCATRWLVKRDECSGKELFVLILERECEAIDNTSQNLKELSNTVVSFGLIDESIENIADGLSDKRTMRHKFAVNAMQNGLEVIALSWILGIKEFKESSNESSIDILSRNLSLGAA
mmetsp:Transcript_8007/g.24065  ORF Transcript_8007/g.24065 Transcript_8007/m.24065 type:complete len:237 (-) Transcript_8007:424-1134(-)